MPAPAQVLRVALALPLPRLFDYLPPDPLPPNADDIGRRLRVPFGHGERIGVVAAVGPSLERDAEGLRRATGFLEPAPVFDGELLASLHWLAQYLHAPLGEVFATALPAALRRGDPLPDTQRRGWRLTEAGATARAGLRTGSRPRALAERLGGEPLDEAVLDATLPGWRVAARALRERGLVDQVALAQGHRGVQAVTQQAAPTPNAEQSAALARISAASGFAPFLLDGVTGSGKTEVYLQAIAGCLAHGRMALVLVPEIGLTPQMLARFRARLGIPVLALHSGLANGERARVWAACHRGEAQVVVGTRSAVFLPLRNAGLIVIDEEHDASYKQQDGIRYHARDFALLRARALGVPVILGSATPSLESLHNAGSGRYRHLHLRKRAGEARPPRVRVLDIRGLPPQAGLSTPLLDAIERALHAGGQVLVFKNRRGYAPVLLCHDCGWSAACSACSTPLQASAMTVHAGGRRLLCHHCGARRAVPPACPDCAGLALQPQGVGTERLEELLAARFTDVPVLRVDRGTTRGRDALGKHLASLGSAPGILVGTQMLAKGHDLPGLTLVAVVGIDEGLFSADFRAGEKLAQLLIQVAGRAGRAEKPGEVWLQTHHPQHALLQTLLAGGYAAFAKEELALREAAGFPPFAYLALLRAEAKQGEAGMAFLQVARSLLEAAASGMPPKIADPGEARQAIVFSGPLPAPMARRAGLHRSQLLLSSAQRRTLHSALDQALPAVYDLPGARKLRWSIDVDPIDLY